MKKMCHALTLVEVVVVVGALAVIAFLFTPCSCAVATEESRRKSCNNNLTQIVKAMTTYQEPNGDFFPAYWDGESFRPTMSMAMLYPGYVDSFRIFACPSEAVKDRPVIKVRQHGSGMHKDFGPVQGNEKSSYFYDELSDPRVVGPAQAMACDADGQTWLDAQNQPPAYPGKWLREPRRPNHTNGQNVTYFDGHIKWMDTVYASDEPKDNIFCPQAGWGADTDAYLWDGTNQRRAEGTQ